MESVDVCDRAPAAWTFSNVIAGSDSVGSLMRTTLYNLLVYPHTLDKLFNELKGANVSRPYPTWTEIRNLPYLDACVLEGIRMHPPFALPFERVVPKGGITIAGQYLPEGTDVGGNAYVVNRHKGWFGDDAEFWRPERWLEKDEAHKRKLEAGILTVSTCHHGRGPDSGFALSWSLYIALLLTVLPKFGGGRRICIGRYVGILEIKKILAFLIANYDVSPPQMLGLDVAFLTSCRYMLWIPIDSSMRIRGSFSRRVFMQGSRNEWRRVSKARFPDGSVLNKYSIETILLLVTCSRRVAKWELPLITLIVFSDVHCMTASVSPPRNGDTEACSVRLGPDRG